MRLHTKSSLVFSVSVSVVHKRDGDCAAWDVGATQQGRNVNIRQLLYKRDLRECYSLHVGTCSSTDS